MRPIWPHPIPTMLIGAMVDERLPRSAIGYTDIPGDCCRGVLELKLAGLARHLPDKAAVLRAEFQRCDYTPERGA